MKNKFFSFAIGVLLSLSCCACSSARVETDSGSSPPAADLPPIESELPGGGNAPTETTPPEAPVPEEPVPEEPAPETPKPSTPTSPPAVTTPTTPAVKTETLVCSTANGLNVRAGAGANYKSIGTLDKSDMAMPVKRTGNWYEILYKGTRGYVSAAYIKEVKFPLGSDKTEKVIAEGKKLLGLPYVYGAQRYHWGNGVRNTNYDGKSYDCSSLMQYIFKIGANVNLAMTSREQSVQGVAVKRADIRRGDLLFFTNASRVNKTGIERIGHVALYLGDNIILHTASDHAVIEPISNARWNYYISARRVL